MISSCVHSFNLDVLFAYPIKIHALRV